MSGLEWSSGTTHGPITSLDDGALGDGLWHPFEREGYGTFWAKVHPDLTCDVELYDPTGSW